jgi:hypothetical protein
MSSALFSFAGTKQDSDGNILIKNQNNQQKTKDKVEEQEDEK